MKKEAMSRNLFVEMIALSIALFEYGSVVAVETDWVLSRAMKCFLSSFWRMSREIDEKLSSAIRAYRSNSNVSMLMIYRPFSINHRCSTVGYIEETRRKWTE